MSLNNSNDARILIVDDTKDNIDILVEIFSNYKKNVAIDGKKALKIALELKPDIILLDVMMPHINGFEVCKELKSNEATKHIPIIFITSKNETADIIKGFEIGGVDYITKPFNNQEVKVRVETHLELKQARDTILSQKSSLELQNNELNKLIETQNEFLGIAAHDLRNPLSAIMLCSEMMQAQYSDKRFNIEKGEEYNKKIYLIAQRMNRLISDLLNISAIESGKVNLDLNEEDLISMLNDNIDFFKRVANEKNINLVFKIEESIPKAKVKIDKFRIIQCIENLLSNSIKYTHPGGEVLVFNQIKDNMILTSVKDTGVGLDENDLKKIFGSFQKLSAKPTRGESSTGLGLAIVKKIIELHNGTISVESKKGKGSTFSISIPLLVGN